MNPKTGDADNYKADQNRHQWLLVGLPRRIWSRDDTRQRRSPPLCPLATSLLRRFIRIDQHLFARPAVAVVGAVTSAASEFAATAAVAAVTLCTRSPIAPPIFVTRASMLLVRSITIDEASCLILQRVLETADSVLDFALNFGGPAVSFKLGIAGCLADSLLD
jgi:hypothetical protein